MFENITYEMILQRMLDRIPTNVDKREGSIIYDAIAPAAFELKLMYFELGYVMEDSFADTASRDFLIRRAAERGITPYPATHAILQGEFTPISIDVTGRRFSMPNSTITYIVKENISAGIYQVECEIVGTQGNHYLGTIVPVDFIQGLETAELTNILIPAQNEEETEHLRQRYFDSFDEKAFGGNVKDYLTKTNSLDGVGSTKVTPIWNGGGTVKLTILDAQYNRASDILINFVQTEIDPTQNNGEGLGLAPIGHVVTVDTVTNITVNIQTNVTLESGVTWASVQQQVINGIQAYLLEQRTEWANQSNLVVRTAQIDTRILMVQGIVDVTNTRINGSTNNLTLNTFEVPVFGGITV
jgi:uncharacterized phage protein gp47/JayE